MQLFLNDAEMPLVAGQKIGVQYNSPLKDLKLTGDKSFPLTILRNEDFDEMTQNVGHVQSDSEVKTLRGRLQHGPFHFESPATIKRVSGQAVTLEMDNPPGGIPSTFWDRKMRDVGLGSYTFQTNQVTTNFYGVPITNKEAGGRELGKYLMANDTTLELRLNSVLFFAISFAAYGQDFEQTEATNRGALEAAITAHNADETKNTKQIFFNGTELAVFSATGSLPSLAIQILYRPPSIRGGSAGNLTLTWPMPQLKYNGITVTDNATVPFRFFEVYAPKFYNEANGDFSGYINTRNNAGTLLKNLYTQRNAYPLVPSFTFKFIFGQIMSKYGITLVDADWTDWEKYYFCSMYDMVEQCSGTTIPFNIYPTTIYYNHYVPDMSVRDFVENALLSIGCTYYFDTENRFRLRAFTTAIASEAVEVNPAKLTGIEFGERLKLKYLYDKLPEDDTLPTKKIRRATGAGEAEGQNADQLTSFFVLPNTTATELKQKFVPFAPLKAYNTGTILTPRANGSWIGTTTTLTEAVPVFTKSVGNSILFELDEETPICRTFFATTALKPTANVDLLALDNANGIYRNRIFPLLEIRTGKLLKLSCYLHTTELTDLIYATNLHFRGTNWIINMIQTSLRDVSNYDVIIEAEKISIY